GRYLVASGEQVGPELGRCAAPLDDPFPGMGAYSSASAAWTTQVNSRSACFDHESQLLSTCLLWVAMTTAHPASASCRSTLRPSRASRLADTRPPACRTALTTSSPTKIPALSKQRPVRMPVIVAGSMCSTSALRLGRARWWRAGGESMKLALALRH